jgi:hypothetical protein
MSLSFRSSNDQQTSACVLRDVDEDSSSRPQYDYYIASKLWEREAAFRLLYRAYVAADLSTPNPFNMRVTKFHLLPESPVFVARLNDNIESTVTMVLDSSEGLPIDAVYPEQIEILRRFNVNCAEMCCLADRRNNLSKGIDSVIGMTRLALHYAIQKDVSCLLLLAHPRHAKFYKRAMGFRAIDKVRSCPFVRGFPAEPLLLNLRELQDHKPKFYDRYFDGQPSHDELIHDPMTPGQIRYFQQFVPPAGKSSRRAA